MIAEYDARTGRITLLMDRDEFTETVEWLEMVDGHDGATLDWRKEHDRLFPSSPQDD